MIKVPTQTPHLKFEHFCLIPLRKMRRSKDTDAHNSSEMAFAIKYNPVRKSHS